LRLAGRRYHLDPSNDCNVISLYPHIIIVIVIGITSIKSTTATKQQQQQQQQHSKIARRRRANRHSIQCLSKRPKKLYL
jgi:hypothetical protein